MSKKFYLFKYTHKEINIISVMNKIFLGIIGINSNYENPYITLLINFSFFIFLLVNIPLVNLNKAISGLPQGP